ncbi:MAG: Ig domain-containing protein, partial [Candidatus Aminicenantes bacterium]|nr:Ig domain-containing protein [Candidatus Aminicenantes bacterium]
VSGTTLPNGDPWLQRQNEPSITVGTLNTQHLLGGSNDYRTVDMPLENEQLPGREGPMAAAPDAWLGLYKSFDGGQSWASTLLPGFPQDSSAAGQASPLKYNLTLRKGFLAAADPVVRSGPAGIFYFSGIAFNRTQIPGWINSALFISRFIDKNDKEAGNPSLYDPIQYVDTQILATDDRTSTVFIDKPWIAVGAPKARAGTITIGGQSVPAHSLHVAYSVFIESAGNQQSSVYIVTSADCGRKWNKPILLSQNSLLNQGATIAVDPKNRGYLSVAWRQFDAKNFVSAIMVARSRNNGDTFDTPRTVAEFTSLQGPLDQPADTALGSPAGPSFRTNSYPTLAVDNNGIIYAAWTQRGQGISGDARIMLATSSNGQTWSQRGAVDNRPDMLGHQFMPSIAFAAGKLTLAWYDQRADFCATQLGYNYWISDGLAWRHTIDVRAAQAETADFPNLNWDTVQISRYNFILEEDANNKGKYKAFQVQWNPPNYTMFATGTLPFHGDYLDVAPSPMFVRDADGAWRFNTAASDNALFHVAWTDNRDVRPPSNGNWAQYAPPTSMGNEAYESPGRPVCMGGQQPGMRNQNVYTAQLVSGIEAGSPTNSKTLDLDVPRAFAVFVKNKTWDMRSFRLSIAAQPPGGQASFLQFELLDYLDVSIAPNSTISRQVFVSSTNPKASVLVNIDEISEPDGTILSNGVKSSILLNGDPTSTGVAGGEETHTPQIENPHIRNWSVNALSVNAEIDAQDLDVINSDIVNPNIIDPDAQNPDTVYPNVVNSYLFNPHIRNTDYTDLSFVNPHIRNPHIRNENPGDVSVTDVEWPVKNAGNTASSFSFTMIAKEALPEGLYAQLIVYKIHYTPAVAGEVLQAAMPTINGCELKKEPHHEILLNVVNPDFVNPHIRNPNLLSPHIRNAAIENATFVLGPGEEAIVNLRIIETHEEEVMKTKAMTTVQGFELPVDVASFVESVGAAVTAQSVDSEDAALGIEEPKTDATMLVITTTGLPPGTLGEPYPLDVYIQAAGGTPGYSWWVNPDELPPGLVFSSATGQISGTSMEDISKTYPCVYSFTVQATDSGSPPQTANQRFSIAIQKPYVEPPPLVITTPSPLPSGTAGKPYGTALNAVGGIWPYRWTRVSGSHPPGLNMDELGTIGGTPSLAGAYTFSVRVTDSAAPVQFQEKAYSLTIWAADAPTFSISGRVTLGAGGTSLPGVLMRGLPSAPTTDASGSY